MPQSDEDLIVHVLAIGDMDAFRDLAALTLWQAAGFLAPLPTFEMSLFKAPEWLAGARTSIALAGVSAAAFAIWMVAEEA